MRVIAGVARGRKLQVPQHGGTRPTPARVREALFSSLGAHLVDARVLDVFAGSGALGIEALSRGAAQVTFIEHDRRAAAIVRRNVAVLPPPLQACTTLVVADALATLARLGREGHRFDLVFVDAPFAAGLLAPTLAALVAGQLLAEGAVVAVEHHGGQPPPAPPAGLTCVRTRRYGEVALASYVGYSKQLSPAP